MAAYEAQCAERVPIEEVFDLEADATRLFVTPIDEWEEQANARFAVPALPVQAVTYFRRFLGLPERPEGDDDDCAAARFYSMLPEERVPYLQLEQKDLERYRRELDAREEYFLTGTPYVRRYNDGENIWIRCSQCLLFNGHFSDCPTGLGEPDPFDGDESQPWTLMGWSWTMYHRWAMSKVMAEQKLRGPYCQTCNREGAQDCLIPCTFKCGAMQHSCCFNPPVHDDDAYWHCGSSRHDAALLLRACALCGSKATPRTDCSGHAVCAACLAKAPCFMCDKPGVDLFCVCCAWRGVHEACLMEDARENLRVPPSTVDFHCFACLHIRGFGLKAPVAPIIAGAWREYQEYIWMWEVKVCNMFCKDPSTVRQPLSKIMPHRHRRDRRPAEDVEDVEEEEEASQSSSSSSSSVPSADGAEEDSGEAGSSEDIPMGELLRRRKEEEAFTLAEEEEEEEEESSSEDVPLGQLAAAAAEKPATKQKTVAKPPLKAAAAPAKGGTGWEKVPDGHVGWKRATRGSASANGRKWTYSCRVEGCTAVRTVVWNKEREIVSDTAGQHNHEGGFRRVPKTSKYARPDDGFDWKQVDHHRTLKVHHATLQCIVAECPATRRLRWDTTESPARVIFDEHDGDHKH